jgi:hypothetical protein
VQAALRAEHVARDAPRHLVDVIALNPRTLNPLGLQNLRIWWTILCLAWLLDIVFWIWEILRGLGTESSPGFGETGLYLWLWALGALACWGCRITSWIWS